MKKFKKLLTLCLALMMVLTCVPAAFAAEADDCMIDEDAKASLTIWKFDWTNAYKDGVWNEDSFISTGWRESYVEEVLGETVREGDANGNPDHPLGNGQNSNGYALKGVEFTILRVADIVTFSESANDQHPDYNLTQVLYGFHKEKAADLLTAIGLPNGEGRYVNADGMVERDNKLVPMAEVDAQSGDTDYYYYQSDVLNKALADALDANATTVKDALEAYVAASNEAIVMDKTNENGKTIKRDLDLGLWLCIETKVPEMVTSTTDPFLVSVPMTTVNGTNAENGGTTWIYDITLYPKNLTGIPALEKTLRENKNDTGKNGGSASDIKDGFAHTGTASSGDVLDYQIISTLPSITSESTYLSCYTFVDTLSKGLSYTKGDVVLEFFTDAACTDLITTWKEADGFFSVAYNTAATGEGVMTIEMTERGLAEINTSKAVYADATMVNSGFSDCTVRITYTAKMDSDNSVIFGDNGNDNKVVLTWKRTSENYFDTLVDDCHVFTYGIDLTKMFSDGKGNFQNVQFMVKNDTDNYFVRAELNEEEGIYYVVDHTNMADEATLFTPVESGGKPGKIIIKGLEDDTYTITEIRTDNGYVLLKDEIEIVISQVETTDLCDIYESDVLGLIQNDPRYAEIIKDTGDLKNMPQKHLEHHLLTASATVDGNKVTMLVDNGSENAEAPLTVVNTRGFDLPETGDNGTLMFTIFGILIMAGAAGILYIATRKKNA